MLLEGHGGDGVADVALVGLLPEQVSGALHANAQKARRQREAVLAGVDARTARAYTCVDDLLGLALQGDDWKSFTRANPLPSSS